MELEVANIYGRALYGAASDLGHVQEVRDELTEIDQIFDGEKKFRDVLANPGISAEEKKTMLRGVFAGRAHDEIVNFMCILVDKGRMSGFHQMVRSFCKIDDEAHQQSDGVVYSVTPLSEAQIEKFEAEAGKLLRKKVILTNKIDPKLIGGIKLFVDGKVVDASLSSRLEEISALIRNS